MRKKMATILVILIALLVTLLAVVFALLQSAPI